MIQIIDRKFQIPIILTLFFVILDGLTKWLVKTQVLPLAYQENTGAAFSIPIPNKIMIIATPLLLILMGYLVFSSLDIKRKMTQTIFALFLAGGIGNLLDRIFRGAVIDFIDLSFWPSFNLADTYLTIAAFLLIIFYGKIKLNRFHKYG